MRFEVRGDAVGAGQCDGDEVHRLLQAVVGFGATEAEEAAAGFAEAFAAEAGDDSSFSFRDDHFRVARNELHLQWVH